VLATHCKSASLSGPIVENRFKTASSSVSSFCCAKAEAVIKIKSI
jgi:hypothetical protein